MIRMTQKAQINKPCIKRAEDNSLSLSRSDIPAERVSYIRWTNFTKRSTQAIDDHHHTTYQPENQICNRRVNSIARSKHQQNTI